LKPQMDVRGEIYVHAQNISAPKRRQRSAFEARMLTHCYLGTAAVFCTNLAPALYVKTAPMHSTHARQLPHPFRRERCETRDARPWHAAAGRPTPAARANTPIYVFMIIIYFIVCGGNMFAQKMHVQAHNMQARPRTSSGGVFWLTRVH
jgi:hypothetical protein